MPTPHGSLPRVRTVCTVAHPWPTFELDGTATPESLSFTYAEDLNDDRVKVEVTFMAVIDRGAPEPETFTQRGNQLRAKEAAELAVLTAEWQSIRDLHADSPAVLAVLDLHFPRRPWAAVQCDHCQTDSDSPEADHVPWPCATYTALTAKRGLPRIGDAVHIVEGGNCAISPVVGHIGDRDPFGDHGIIVTPGGREAEWLPTHQDETRTVEGSWHWPCSTELLAGSEPNAPAPVTVNITVQGSVGSEQGFAEAIRRDLLRHGNSQTWQSF